MEKNSKARQLILCGLTRTDIDKVIGIPTAKDMWEAIISIHRGSDDQKDTRNFTLQREFKSFKKLPGESVSACQSRFTILMNKLTASGVMIEPSEQTLAVIYAMSEKFELTWRIALMSPDCKKLSVVDIFGKFFDQENADLRKGLATKEATGTALKLTKVLEKLDINDGEEEEDDDTEVALMTKMVKKWFKKRAGQEEPSSSTKRDLKEYTCFNCQEKGHLARTCTNPKVEATEKKALFSAWEEEGDEADLHEGYQGQCLMANSEARAPEVKALAPEVKASDPFPTRINLLEKKELINIIKGLLEDNETLESQINKYEEEVKDLRSECLELSTRLANKEKDLVMSKELSLMTKTCEGCNGKQPQGRSSKNLESKVESDLGIIIAKITELNDSINKNTVNQTIFVRSRTGIGYDSDVGSSKCSSVNEKLTRELSKKAETLDKALQICRSKNEFLEKKVKALEQPSGDNHSWF